MRVDANNSYPGVTGISRRSKSRETQAAPEAQDSPCTNEAERLKRSLETPDIRADKVARAKALVSEPSYPQDSVLSRVADVLSKNLAPGQ